MPHTTTGIMSEDVPCATRGWRNGPRCCFELEDRESFRLAYAPHPVNVEKDEKMVKKKNFFFKRFVWRISVVPWPSVHPYDQF